MISDDSQYIIAISGRKSAGKNTIARRIALVMHERNPSLYASLEHSFADSLKEFCINTLGLTYEQCYGTDSQKNSLTSYRWENVADEYLRWKFGPRKIRRLSDPDTIVVWNATRREYYNANCIPLDHRTGFMSGREIMQIFGTELVRETFGNVWAAATVRHIKSQDAPVNLITDTRFENEISVVLSEPKGFVIRLTRSPFGDIDSHPSEASLDGYDWNRRKCYVLDNKSMTIEEQNKAIEPILNDIFSNRK